MHQMRPPHLAYMQPAHIHIKVKICCKLFPSSSQPNKPTASVCLLCRTLTSPHDVATRNLPLQLLPQLHFSTLQIAAMGVINIFLIRHGESVDNVAGLLYGPARCDAVLSRCQSLTLVAAQVSATRR